MSSKHIVIAGGSGFIGNALAGEFLARDFKVVVLTRTPRERIDGVIEAKWDGRHVGEWAKFLNGAEAIINLAGKNINCPHTPENLHELTGSRINSVHAIAAAFEVVKIPPRVWVQASAIGFYGNTGCQLCDESVPNGSDTLAEICREWEIAFNSANTPTMRKILLRIGFVLGRDGGALPVLSKITRCFLGGSVGNGRQYISWIHIADLTRMFAMAVENENLRGTFNAVGQYAVMNLEFMRELRHALHRPWSPPAPVWAVKLGSRLMSSEPSLALAGCRSIPKRFLEAGFNFQFSNLPDALENLCG